MKQNLVEETYEVLQALDGTDPDELCEELGDLLLQVVFHSQISKEKGEFDAYEVCRRLYQKLVRRHPHVFGKAAYKDTRELLKHWEDIKAAERKARGRPAKRKSMLDGIPKDLPALYAAYQVSSKASRVGFDWPHLEGIRNKFLEEFVELQKAIQDGCTENIKKETGDLLLAAVNIARFLQIDPETALSRANAKFSDRFRKMEEHFSKQGRPLKEVDLQEMEAHWQAQKQV